MKKMLNVDVERSFRETCAFFPWPLAVRRGVLFSWC